MNAEKFTQKSIEAIKLSQSIAFENSNQQIEQAHLLFALLSQNNSLIKSLIESMSISTVSLINTLQTNIDSLPKVSGGEIYFSQRLASAIDEAEKIASQMKDDYISVEHIMLGIIRNPDQDMKILLKSNGITENNFLTALKNIRGSNQVKSDNPEETYDALKKYGKDLTEMARNQKLDPVIGRDEEIRNVIRILSRKTKNNPCLIGEPGVGKTAIVEGLAARIIKGDVPERLKNRTVFSPLSRFCLISSCKRMLTEERLCKSNNSLRISTILAFGIAFSLYLLCISNKTYSPFNAL